MTSQRYLPSAVAVTTAGPENPRSLDHRTEGGRPPRSQTVSEDRISVDKSIGARRGYGQIQRPLESAWNRRGRRNRGRRRRGRDRGRGGCGNRCSLSHHFHGPAARTAGRVGNGHRDQIRADAQRDRHCLPAVATESVTVTVAVPVKPRLVRQATVGAPTGPVTVPETLIVGDERSRSWLEKKAPSRAAPALRVSHRRR